MTLNDNSHKHSEKLLHIHDRCHVIVMTLCYAHPLSTVSPKTDYWRASCRKAQMQTQRQPLKGV